MKLLKESKYRSEHLIRGIHTDIRGPLTETKTIGRALYFITFIDDKSRYITVYFQKNTSNALKAFKEHMTFAEKNQKLFTKGPIANT